MNGDIGTVLEVTKDSVVVDFECYQEPRRFSRKEAYDLELAWALTIHKAQGSEWPWVMVVCHSSQHYMLSRQLIYTAITRAKKGVILVGDRKGIDRALSNNRPAERRTRLQEALRGEEED
ncbi:MAG: ATP-binding domain-containing protein, partial [Gemmatimonadota bacterium]